MHASRKSNHASVQHSRLELSDPPSAKHRFSSLSPLISSSLGQLCVCTCPLLSSSYRFSRNGSPPLVRPSFTRTSRNSNSLGVLSVQGGGISFACSEATFSMGSFTEYDHVWKLDVRGLGRDVIIGIIGIICVLRAASLSAGPGVVSDQTIDARS